MCAVFLLFIGPKLSKLSSPQAVALLRSLVTYLQVRTRARGLRLLLHHMLLTVRACLCLLLFPQYLSLSLDIRLRWPPALLAFFAWLKARACARQRGRGWSHGSC